MLLVELVGYIGTNFWNKGRTQEIKERVLHLDNKDIQEKYNMIYDSENKIKNII